MSYSQLPIEIWREISLVDHHAYYVMVRCCKQFALDQDYVKSLFIRTYMDKDKNTLTKLPNGWLHSCNNLPAMIKNGYSFWYRNNNVHRDNDLPAVIHLDGYRAWYINDRRHRNNDLPAKIYSGGRQEWWVDDIHQRTVTQKNN